MMVFLSQKMIGWEPKSHPIFLQVVYQTPSHYYTLVDLQWVNLILVGWHLGLDHLVFSLLNFWDSHIVVIIIPQGWHFDHISSNNGNFPSQPMLSKWQSQVGPQKLFFIIKIKKHLDQKGFQLHLRLWADAMKTELISTTNKILPLPPAPPPT